MSQTQARAGAKPAAHPRSHGASSATDMVLSSPVALPNTNGLHARPATMLATAAKRFRSDIRLVRAGVEGNAKSVVGIIGLGAECGDALQIKATGDDAREAVMCLVQLLANGCGESAEEMASHTAPAATTVMEPVQVAANEIAGVAASPGLVIGKVVQLRRNSIEVAELGVDHDTEQLAMYRALESAWKQIEALKGETKDTAQLQILSAHQELLTDPELIDGASEWLLKGKSAGFAWRAAFTDYATKLSRLQNALLRERADDIRDVGRRVLALIAGVAQDSIAVPPGSIIIAEELTPSDTVSLDRKNVVGFCTSTGGATSHVAILARSLDLPAVCGIDAAALKLANGTPVILDGLRGVLRINPDAADLKNTRERIARTTNRRQLEQAKAHEAAVTRDGYRVEVAANIRNAQDAREAVAAGGDGVGLLRSEFLFEDRATAPSEAEQAAEYRAVAEALGRDRTLVVRTLDVGGDKPLPYMPLPHEDNPFLGLRGIRVSLAHPEFFRAQLRAIGKAAPFAKLHIMFPMIASLEELRDTKRIVAEEIPAGTDVKIGVMIEVPSAVLIAEQLAREADFFSIGTNDLTQYVLAMDRGHPQLARQADALHPAVLKMIGMAVAGAHKHGRWVGVCGGLASDPLAVPALIGLGVDELSVSVPAIAQVKAAVGRLSRADCVALARELLQLGTSSEVRERLLPFAEEETAKA